MDNKLLSHYINYFICAKSECIDKATFCADGSSVYKGKDISNFVPLSFSLLTLMLPFSCLIIS